MSLVKAWLDDGVLQKFLPPKPLTQQEIRDPKFCIYHQRVRLPTPKCYWICRIYCDKVQKGDILQPQRAEVNTFPNHKVGHVNVYTVDETVVLIVRESSKL